MGALKPKGVPWDAVISQNGVMSRTLIEVLGYHPYAIALARNNFERLERFLDIGCWMVASIGIPVILENVFNRYITRTRLMKRFGSAFVKGVAGKEVRPFEVPFEWLDKAGFKERMARFAKDPVKVRQLQRMGIKSFKHLTPALAGSLLMGKFGIMLFDYLAMAVKGQGYSWGKNLITERLSKKSGFSGEFTYTDEAFRAEIAKKKAEQRKQLIQSLVIGFGGAIATPLLVLGLLKNRAISADVTKAAGKGLGGKLKRLIPVMNPYRGVFMSRWGLLPHNIFNWNIPAILAARDKHELRELLVRAVVFDFFYFIGDDIFSGLASKVFVNRHKHELDKLRVAGKPLQFTRKGPFGLPLGRPFGEILEELKLGHGRNLPESAKTLIQRVSRYQFWTGIITTAIFFGIATTMLNNWYTRKRVEAEKATFNKTHGKPEPTRSTKPARPANPIKPLVPAVPDTMLPSDARTYGIIRQLEAQYGPFVAVNPRLHSSAGPYSVASAPWADPRLPVAPARSSYNGEVVR
ncbi:MAG: hypothetical protein KC475_02485 [Cyanobacteria bacterium HKST-UBA03]|nr:hypothetical protein [Cyanobacteria bacterium HKST-UBA03]